MKRPCRLIGALDWCCTPLLASKARSEAALFTRNGLKERRFFALNRLDVEAIFTVLGLHGVAYILVGTLGAIAHGARLHTADVDLCIATSPVNQQRMAAVLHVLNAQVLRIPPRGVATIALDDWTTLRLDDPTEHHLFHTRVGDIDVLPQPLDACGWNSITDYQRLARTAVTMMAFGLPIRVAAFEYIMASKLRAGRAQDVAATAELQRVGHLSGQGESTNYGLEQFATELLECDEHNRG